MTDSPLLRSPPDVLAATVPLAGRRIVDVGCGEGTLSRFLASRGAAEVIGVECGEEMLAHARAGEAHAALRFVAGVGQDLPLPDECAELVVFSNSLHHVPGHAQFDALREARRVLVPEGDLFVLEPIARGPNQRILEVVHDESEVRAHAQAQLDEAIAKGLFVEIGRFEFTKLVQHRSFDAFRDRILRINPHLQNEVDAAGESWRELFERVGIASEQGWSFEQEIAFAHLRRA